MRPPFVLLVAWLSLGSCAAPIPKCIDYYRQVPQTDVRLQLDMDLLNSSELSQHNKQFGQEYINDFHNWETSLRDYLDALEANIDANEQLKNRYSIADAIVGGVASVSSIGVIFATAAIAAPIAGVVWIAVGLSIQQFNIQPQIEEGRKVLDNGRDLALLFRDSRVPFRAVAYADSNDQADRRFKVWQSFNEDLKARISRFLAKPVE